MSSSAEIGLVGQETEVTAKARRRQFTAEYKRKVLAEAEACTKPGEIGALLRREGLYSSHLVEWRRARDSGALAGLAPRKRGPAAKVPHPLERKVLELQRENTRLKRRAERAEGLVELQKSVGAAGDPAAEARRGEVMQAVTDLGARLGIAASCAALGLPKATYYRALKPRPPRRTQTCHRALGVDERRAVLDVLHEPRFAELAPAQVYATLLDEGRYLCSERTMYRVLAENAEVRERRDQLRHPKYKAPELLATAPNQLWSWDITKLLGPQKWTYFYLYVILDVYSRYVVGWMLRRQRSRATVFAGSPGYAFSDRLAPESVIGFDRNQ